VTAWNPANRRGKKNGAPLVASSTLDIDYPADEIEWLMAVDRYKREKSRPFPSLHELYGLFIGLGYQKKT
jgi:hypothetical protein